jgi:hypothetical protein
MAQTNGELEHSKGLLPPSFPASTPAHHVAESPEHIVNGNQEEAQEEDSTGGMFTGGIFLVSLYLLRRSLIASRPLSDNREASS